MTKTEWRLPAEWEDQSAILLAWPHAGTDWADRLDEVETTYVELVCAITRFQPVLLAVADVSLKQHADALLANAGVNRTRLNWVTVDYDDTWLRDSGPISLRSPDGKTRLLDFRFTGWGGKFEASRDDALIGELVTAGVFGQASHQRVEFALEGGAIDVDGGGTLLSTWQCLAERHPGRSREDIASVLMQSLAQRRVLWLDHGYLEGDDTDAHIDTLARFASPGSIVYQACDDPADPHFTELQAMADDLAALRTDDGQPYQLYALPWAQPILDDGRRLAASYANFLIINGAVLMPAYGDSVDGAAAAVLQQAFPGREVIRVPCRSLIWQNGSLHCISMQLPTGVFRND